MKQNFAALQIGSGTLHLMSGRRGVSDTFIVAGESKSDYAGYAEGEFCEPEKLAACLKRLVEQVEAVTQEPITKLYVGVPTDFCRVIVGDATISFDRSHKVSMEDIDRLYNMACTFSGSEELQLINKSPIFFTTDNDRKIVEALGVKTLKLQMKACFVYAETSFLETMNAVLGSIGISGVEYLSTALAEMQFLFDDSTRMKPVVMLDVGGGNTSVVIGQGDGLLSVTSIGFGGGFLTSDLAMCFHISYENAESLKAQIVLSLDAGIEDKYPIVFRGKTKLFSAIETNSIITERLLQISDIIKRVLSTASIKIPQTQDLYVTGGGLLHLRGAKDYLAKCLGYNLIPVSPGQPLWDKPEHSQILSLLDLALDINNY